MTAAKSPAKVASKTAASAAAKAEAKAPARTARPQASVTHGSATAPAAAKPSKDELRIQVEKLESANKLLRAKQRDAGRAAKIAAARIAELEDQVAGLQKQLTPPARRSPKTAGGAQPTRTIDPGDAVPPGVAVEQPAPLDAEAEAALENLEHHLGDTQ